MPKRQRVPPKRFIPGGSADVPSEFEDMVHEIALQACKASPLPLDGEAVMTLEQALLPAMETFVTAAHVSAVLAACPCSANALRLSDPC